MTPEATHQPGRSSGGLAVLVLIACIAAYWCFLGVIGLAWHEGNHVAPGWELVDTGHWLSPRTLDQPDLARPPAMSWAVGASAWVFGKKEAAARGVSAQAMTILAFAAMTFGARWFGRRGGLACGFCAATLPLFVLAGRVAESEALATAATGVGLLLYLGSVVPGGGRSLPRELLGGLVLGMALLASGPVGLLPIAAGIVGSCFAMRSTRPLTYRATWVMLFLAIAMYAAWFALAQRDVAATGKSSLVESAWDVLKASDTGLVSIRERLIARGIALACAAPALLVLPIVRLACPGADAEDRSVVLAKCAAWSVGIGVILCAAIGSGGFRGSAPLLALAPVPVGFVVAAAQRRAEGSRAAIWSRRLLFRGQAWIWAIMMLGAAVALGPVWDWSREPMESGRDTGVSIGDALPDNAVVWVDELARVQPELLAYALMTGKELNKPLRIIWRPDFAARGELPEAGGFVVLRYDDASTERDARAKFRGRLAPIFNGEFNRFTFNVYRVLK
jgi:4-amino-4-deoxy-L-arabinose transferase-like glycosyltransferase